MLLIYSAEISLRLQYICKFIFDEVLGVSFNITLHDVSFNAYEGPKINYSDLSFSESYTIRPHKLLFEKEIKLQELKCTEEDGRNTFFNTPGSDHSFDIFAAVFYLISRYEEYLPHRKDMYGRYAHENSLAFKEGFLNIPLINVWAKNFAVAIQKRFQSFNFQLSTFNFTPTYDIDIAYSYKHKGLVRNIGGFLKSPSAERIKVLTGAAKDPFDAYAWLDNLHEQFNLQPVYFFLVAEKNGPYDKNILPHKKAMEKIIKQHAKKYSIGLHPSWQSGDNKSLLKKEKERLIAMIKPAKSVPAPSRQHYIRFNLPEGYQRLITAGLTDDYSMGYGSINGFRASTASSFFWYDLEKEAETNLRIHPFCFMDANSYYEQRQTSEQTFIELMHYLSVCKAVNGTLITIWHNNFLGTANEFNGWAAVYEKFIVQVRQ